MQDRLSATDSINALLVSMGLRPSETGDIAAEIVALRHKTTLRQTILRYLDGLNDRLRIHTAHAIIKLLETTMITAETIWHHLVRIWHEVEFNIAVASHRLNSSLPAKVAVETAPVVVATPRARSRERVAVPC